MTAPLGHRAMPSVAARLRARRGTAFDDAGVQARLEGFDGAGVQAGRYGLGGAGVQARLYVDLARMCVEGGR